ncbi:hypothetical protein MTR67_049798 [Solanum verrucosum]|uniref:Uncharacterized protein n=1 Tax=Solanum verrucosum TaxID=315347 RepID=A0AAF0V443_SOLVR|nr:hypothetical protein MTR67_049798 [Solanum verrucosum]
MDALETIDLSNNNLDGPIPDFFGTLPNLKELNLANNKFSGPVPASLSNKNGLTIDTSGNSDLCSSSDESCQNNDSSSPGNDQPSTGSTKNNNKKKKNNLPIILGTTILTFSLVWAIAGQISGGRTPFVDRVQMSENFEKNPEVAAHDHQNSTNV